MTKVSRPTRILLIDDDPQMTRLVEAALRKSLGDQAVVECFCDAKAARRRVEEGDIDVIVTDLEMPALNGMEILRYAKARNASIQVIVITGKSSHQVLLEALECGAADYLVKPVEREALVEAVTQAMLRVGRWRRALAATWSAERMDETEVKSSGQLEPLPQF